MSPSRWQRDPLREPEFERCVADCAPSLLRNAYLLVADASAAEDLLQLALLRTAGRWRSARQSPEAYARRVLLNLVRDRWRRSARRVAERPLAEATGTGRDQLSSDHAEGVAGREEVFGALARLPAEQREVLVLRFYADLSVAETAAATGTSEGTVKSGPAARWLACESFWPTHSQPQSSLFPMRSPMMTDEQLIERIRTALGDEAAGVHPPADLLERLRSGPAPRGPRPFWAPTRVGGAVAALASVAVVASVVVVFASIGHGRSSPSSVSTVPAGTPAGARGLVARLAVLRRPQTAADRLPALLSAELGAAPNGLLPFRFAMIPSLTRIATTVNVGAGPLASVDIYVVVGRPAGYSADIVTTLAVGGRPGHHQLGIPEVVDEQTALAAGGLTIGAVGSAGSRDGTRGVNAGVVPDGVSRVKWVFRVAGGRSVTVYPKVENNVAVARAAGLGVSSATWYGSDGRVITSYNELAQRLAEETSLLAGSARRPIAAALIKHFAIFRRPVPAPAAIRHLPRRTAIVIARHGYGLNVTQARFVPYPGTPGLWVIPGASGVSMAPLAGPGGGAGDNVPVSMALSGGMISTSCCSRDETVQGLVPDGNPTVTVMLAGGATRTVPVIDNVYSVTATEKVVSVIAKDAAGHGVTIHAPG